MQPNDECSVTWRGQVITGPNEKTCHELIANLEEQEARRARWPQDTQQAMTMLGRLFPTLARAGDIGIDPWNPEHLIAWLNGPAPGSGAKWAGRFLLSVWNPTTDWTEEGLRSQGRFNFFEAMGVWDDEHVNAMKRWIDAPFWP